MIGLAARGATGKLPEGFEYSWPRSQRQTTRPTVASILLVAWFTGQAPRRRDLAGSVARRFPTRESWQGRSGRLWRGARPKDRRPSLTARFPGRSASRASAVLAG